MKKVYRVRWDMDIEADSPEDAARLALAEIRNKHTAATNFDVFERYEGDTLPDQGGSPTRPKPYLYNLKMLGWIQVKLPEE